MSNLVDKLKAVRDQLLEAADRLDDRIVELEALEQPEPPYTPFPLPVTFIADDNCPAGRAYVVNVVLDDAAVTLTTPGADQ